MAEQVEAEQDSYENPPEPDEPEPDEPEPEPAQAIGPDELRKAERAIDAHRKKLAGILGESYVAHDCLLCAGVGFVPELPPIGTVLTLAETEEGPTLEFAAPNTAESYPEARDKQACDWCEAFGFVRSGSKNPNAAVVPCSKCSGNGWVAKPVDVPPAATTYAQATYAEANTPPPPPGIGEDPWGRPAGHKHWGVAPALIPG